MLKSVNRQSEKRTPLVKIGPKHQITIPKEIFEILRLAVGDLMEIRAQSGVGVVMPKRVVNKKPYSAGDARERKIQKDTRDDDEKELMCLASDSLARSYGEDEPSYTSEMLIHRNPAYEGG